MDNEKIRVCIVGAGAAGLCALRHVSRDLQRFEPAAFEQNDKVGGTWIYVDRTGADDHGNPMHSSMYKNLRTNIPMKLMNFPDYQGMSQTQPSCGSHEQILAYLNSYADHFDLRRFIQFDTKVERVQPIVNADWRKTTWRVSVKNFRTDAVEERIFDAVMICNGHYAVPRVPKIPGIETFPGRVMHSHDYRKPEMFEGKTVIVLGVGPSGIDIGIEITKYANFVYLSHNNSRFPSPLPTNMSQVMGLASVDGNKFTLKDDTVLTADALIYCTGYEFTFPFLTEDCKIKVDDNFITPIYKHLINIEHPTMCLVGLPSRVIPFVIFHVQVQFFLGLLRGKFQLPSKDIMIAESRLLGAKRHAHVLGDDQWDYDDELANIAGIDKVPEFYKNGYTKWNTVRMNHFMKCKDSGIVVDEDGKTVRIILQNEPEI